MGEVEHISVYHLNYLNSFVISSNEYLFIIDNDCNQAIININSILAQYFTGICSTIGGALNSMLSSELKLDTDTYTLVTLPNHTIFFQLTKLF